MNGQVTHWRRLPAINITDIQLRTNNQLVTDDQLVLYNKRHVFRFILSRPIYDVDLPELAGSLGLMYADLLRAAGQMGACRYVLMENINKRK